MASCTRKPQSSCLSVARDAGFATALAMAVSLAIGIGATALVLRSETDLRAARVALERTQADYRLDAIQELAEEAVRTDPGDLKSKAFRFANRSAEVALQSEALKVPPSASEVISDGWLASLRLAQPQDFKARLKQASALHPLNLQRLADLDASPTWKTCAADGVSESGQVLHATSATIAQSSVQGLPQTIRLTALEDDGWVDDRIVRLTNDPADPNVVLDRRFYRRTGMPRPCPPPPLREGS